MPVLHVYSTQWQCYSIHILSPDITWYMYFTPYSLQLLYIFQEISGRIMEERERLSLGTRSRATSGTSSPVPSNSTRSKAQVTPVT